jgi:hypothetical protein
MSDARRRVVGARLILTLVERTVRWHSPTMAPS